MSKFSGWGRRGGRSRSVRKVEAARANGADGGRPKKRTLAERILRCDIPDEQRPLVDAAFRAKVWFFARPFSDDERAQILRHFSVEGNSLNTFCYQWTRPSSEVRKALRRLRHNYSYDLRFQRTKQVLPDWEKRTDAIMRQLNFRRRGAFGLRNDAVVRRLEEIAHE